MRALTRSTVLLALAVAVAVSTALVVWVVTPRPAPVDVGTAPVGVAPLGAATAEPQPSTPPATTGSRPPGADEALELTLFVDGQSVAAAWAAANPDDPRADVVSGAIASQPAATWVPAGDPGAVGEQVRGVVDRAAGAGDAPTLVVAAPELSGCEPTLTVSGEASASVLDRYDAVARAVGDSSAVVVAEPYALRILSCVREEDERVARLAVIADAVRGLAAAAPSAVVYLGGGGPFHADAGPEVMADRLAAAAVADARGFVLNVTEARPTAESETFAAQVNDVLAERIGDRRPYAVDTSRNGARPPPEEPCNSTDLRLGEPPGHTGGGVGDSGPELRLWLLQPGVSEGDCGSGAGTARGEFLPDLAVEMARDAT